MHSFQRQDLKTNLWRGSFLSLERGLFRPVCFSTEGHRVPLWGGFGVPLQTPTTRFHSKNDRTFWRGVPLIASSLSEGE